MEAQVTATSQVQPQEEEYYDDYEEEYASTRKDPKKQQFGARSRDRENSRKQIPPSSHSLRPDPYDVEEKPRSKANRDSAKRPVVMKDYYDDYEDEEEIEVQRKSAVRNSEKRTKPSTSTSTSTTTTTSAPVEKIEPVVRLVKRPFLPSRGGNPFTARGLQPVGSKAVARAPERVLGEDVAEDNVKNDEPYNVVHLPQESVNSDDFHPQIIEYRKPYQSQGFPGPRTTQKPKVSERNPLDINEEDYDVTLNDALNPTLPNVPVRGSPAGFSSGSDYSFAGPQRPRYNLEPAASSTSSEYVYQTKPLRQTFQAQREQFVQSNIEYTGQYSNYRPRQVQQQTEVFYSRY